MGFKTVEQAAAALKYFNKSFMDTSKLEVTAAQSFKTIDKAQNRPWSKHSEGSSAHAATQRRKEREDPDKNDAQRAKTARTATRVRHGTVRTQCRRVCTDLKRRCRTLVGPKPSCPCTWTKPT